ncbi:hypothetical protein [Vibrio diabolicus]|uniref:hypothetical protein n=1 Tax=Vibrio diabolicus TaxID=50719 RepID=UPI00193AFDAF|nr:hypothetical protein [Vibrio diabolicus]
MSELKQTKELLSIVSNQKSANIPGWMAKDASKKLSGDKPNTERAESIIKKLNESEMHPALAAKVRDAQKEIEQHKKLSLDQPQKRSMKM